MKKITVVITCYNVSKYLGRCWNSLKNQTIGAENLEFIFVDDASDDDGLTWKELQKIEAESPENVLIVQSDKNVGPGGARNIGISYATGEYLQFIDADDEFVLDGLEKLYRIAEENQTDIIQFNHILTKGDIQRVNKVSVGNRLEEIKTDEDRIKFLNATIVTYGCTNKFYRLSLIQKAEAKFAEECVYEEPLFVYPLFLYAERVYLCEEGLYVYHLHDGSVVTSRIGKQLLDHPDVQLRLLEYCMTRTDLYQRFSGVIECYFLWSYYCETILFTGERKDAFLPVEYLTQMQAVCLKLFPNWRENKYILNTSSKVQNLMESLYRKFETQQDLDSYIREINANF